MFSLQSHLFEFLVPLFYQYPLLDIRLQKGVVFFYYSFCSHFTCMSLPLLSDPALKVKLRVQYKENFLKKTLAT